MLKPTYSPVPFDKQGHRGARGLMPENTIPAMIKAVDLGVTTLEMDVVISKDKKVVVSHDPYFNSAIATQPDGRILTSSEEKQYPLFGMDYDIIKQWDVGKRGHPLFAQQARIPAHKPLLAELIDSVETYVKKNHLPAIRYNIETKSSIAGDGKFNPTPEEFIRLLVQVVQAKNITKRTIIQSFDIRTLQELHRTQPKIATSFLIDASSAMNIDQNLKRLGFIPSIYSPEFRSVTPALINLCHEKGMSIIPWTVNDAAEIKRLKDMGVDGIISDYPNLFER